MRDPNCCAVRGRLAHRGMAPSRNAREPWMSPRTPRRTEGTLPQSSAQAGTARVRRDASRLHHSVGIQRGYLCRGDASWLHCARRDTARLPPHAHILYCMQYPLFQGPHFLQNSPLLAQALSTGQERHRKEPGANSIVEIEVATCARSIEVSDCNLRPFPDPSAPLGIEWWLRSQRASATPASQCQGSTRLAT